ncbi:MAG: tetratricopeptide repeat protein [Chloroflexi bacterium]|nr:tetratricopeptide repeat protein [Chloroflexota bacterium]MBK7180534.1 tetratricopeptide repeat protein [Chloroflexota bacterium]MBK8934595.1 tetratricopeptide repeat protein [Chloroflexota bacterium]MBP6803946.1 tetratricopeptide repeat protein [Chloroflexota bacterium]MBP7590781.1 tetratricopeptide repeat protein [Chloroflexota bacterium]
MATNRARYEEALNRGHTYGWDQRWPEAIEAFNEAARDEPTEPAPFAGLGMAYMELNQLEKALENYKLAARYSRGEVMHLQRVAEVQELLGMADEAGKTYMAIGEIELNRKRLDDAMTNWHRAVRLEPNLLRAHQRLASIYQRQGAVRNAIQEYLAIARILQTQGEKNKALQACQLALQLDPRNPDVLTALEMVRQGEPLFAKERPAGPVIPSKSSGLLRMAVDLEKDVQAWVPDKRVVETAVPVQDARRMAMEQLAVELFEDDTDDAHSANKIERDFLISQALDFQRRSLVNEAISAYEQALAAGLSSTAARFNLGLLYQDKLRFEDAIREFEFSVKDQEYRLASYFALGESYRARGQINKSIESFINVLKIVDMGTVRHDQADRLIELYENLTDSLVTQGESEKATAFANSLVEFLGHKGWEDKVKEARQRLDAFSDTGMMILGDVLTSGTEKVLESLYLSQEYARRGMYNTAIEETYRAIQLSPDYLPAHIQLGEVLARQGRHEMSASKFTTIADTFKVRGDVNGAIMAYEKVLELAPLDLAARARLIDLLKQHGRIDRALEHYMIMGEGYYQLAQVDKAREIYQEALKLAPRGEPERNWAKRMLRAMVDIDVQRFEWRRALPALRDLRELQPDDEWTAMTLVDMYFKVGQPQNAVRSLDQYLMQLVRTGKGVKVVGILEDMVQQRPSDPNLVDRLTRLYIQQRQNQEAVAILDKLGEAQLEAGDKAAAVITIEKILKLSPPNAASYKQLLSQLK